MKFFLTVEPKNIYINKHLFSKDSFKLDEIYKYFLSVIVFIISLFDS